jgi:glycosyltransferase involved in cell wall biosynthesis
VLTVHDIVRLRSLQGVRRWLYRLLWFSLPLRLAAAVTVVSETTGKELADEFPRVTAKLRVIPNPLPTGLGPAEHQQRGNGVPVILHVGTTENKNLDLSIAVAKMLGSELSILGRLQEHQRATLERSGIAFHAQHDVPDESLAGVYRSSDVLLFASLAEGFGMPIIEAQACGIPVVTSDLEPMRSVAGHAALLIDPSDVDAAVSAVRSLLETASLREELVQAGLLNAARYEPKAIAAAYADVYRSFAVTAN